MYFGCGNINIDNRKFDTYKYIVSDNKLLIEKIIPHFEKYPLVGSKHLDLKKGMNRQRLLNTNLVLSKDKLNIIKSCNKVDKKSYHTEVHKDRKNTSLFNFLSVLFFIFSLIILYFFEVTLFSFLEIVFFILFFFFLTLFYLDDYSLSVNK
jgi:hypothetical protein